MNEMTEHIVNVFPLIHHSGFITPNTFLLLFKRLRFRNVGVTSFSVTAYLSMCLLLFRELLLLRHRPT